MLGRRQRETKGDLLSDVKNIRIVEFMVTQMGGVGDEFGASDDWINAGGWVEV